MTLARKFNGVLHVGGVWCEECGKDTYVSSKRPYRCISGHASKYRAKGTVVSIRNPDTGQMDKTVYPPDYV